MTTVRSVRSDDHGALCEVLSGFPWEGITQMSWPERIRHWWEDNPAFDPSVWDRGWVIEDGSNLVGFLGSVPRRVAFEGRVKLSANATTWWVAPRYRSRSLALLQRFSTQEAAGHFSTTGSPSTHRMLEAFGYRPFPGAGWARESFAVVDPARLVAAKVRERTLRGSPATGALANRLAMALAPFGSSIQKLRLPAVRRPYDWAELARPDERFDPLADVMRRRYRYTAERDRESLDWYLRGEGPDRKVLLTCERDGMLAGFAIFLQRESGTLSDVAVLDCIDLVRDRDDTALLAAIVAGATEIARRRRVPLVVFRHFDEFLGAQYRQFGLYTRMGPPRREFADLPSFADSRGYYLTQFHGDLLI